MKTFESSLMTTPSSNTYGPHSTLNPSCKSVCDFDDFEIDLTLEDGSKFELLSSPEDVPSARFQHEHAHGRPVLGYDEALSNYEAVCNEIKATGEYKAARALYRFASFELNAHGKQAPAFRRALETGKKLNDPVFLQIHRDHIAIDCHWLKCIKAEVHVNEGDQEFAPLFDPSQPFDFELADHFASKKWKAENRTLEVLRLIEFYQCQCITLKSDALKSKLKSLDQPRKESGKRVPSVRSVFERKLLTWGASVKSIAPHYPTYRALWTLHMLLGSTINSRMLSTLTALALGQPKKDAKTIKTQLDTLLRRVNG